MGARLCWRVSWHFRVRGAPRPRSQGDYGAMAAQAIRARGVLLAMKRQTAVWRLRAETMVSKNAPLRTSALPTTSKGVRLTPVTASAKGAVGFVGVVTAVVGVVVPTVAVV